jgi:serine/threonine protein kinase
MAGDGTLREQSGDDLLALIRRQEAQAIALDVMRRRAAGEVVADEEVIARHVAFMPELAQELKLAREIHDLAVAARKAGMPEPDAFLRILSHEELEAPLGTLPGESVASISVAAHTPRIPGFAVLDEIGRGGQAIVYRAVQESTGRRVAVKVLAGGTATEAEQRARFDQEVRLLAAINHAHIVSIIDRGRTEAGAFYLAMELVEGWSFEEFAAECRSVDDHHPRLLLEAMAKVARAVHAAHEQGIVHRDLKSSNIRVDRRGEPRVLDFGLAKSSDSTQSYVTATGELVGSLPWFSPEVAGQGQRAATARSDIYALGVVFYQALAGKFPYPVTGSLPDVLKQICSAKPEPLPSSGAAAKHVKDLQAVLAKAMAKAPTERYATAVALAEDLSAIAIGRRPAATRDRRTRIWRCLWGVVAAVIIVANVVWWIWPRQHMDEQLLPKMRNRFGMEMVQAPAGLFTMGIGDGRPDTRPHPVTLTRSFWIGTTEVTQSQYAAVMGTAAPPTSSANLPEVNLSREDAEEFCRRLSAKEGRKYRLPTEAEWEYAAFAHSYSEATFYPMDQCAWHTLNAGGKLHPVAMLAPNPWGLYDVLGNADEWCADGYAPYPATPAVDPLPNPNLGDKGVTRGGNRMTGPRACTPTLRMPQRLGQKHTCSGLRVVLVSDPPSTVPAN